jgi:hypothetical protein
VGRASLVLLLAGLLPAAVSAQQIEQGVPIVAERIASRVDGFSYRANTSSDLLFRGTTVAARATGTARIRTAVGHTEISARLEKLPDVASLGPFTVYALWVITPEGRATNVGIFEVNGDRARLDTTTPLSAFALIVTAEPYFAVSVPGQDVVAQTIGQSVKGSPLEVRSLASRADYSTLARQPRDPKAPVPLEVEMARYALVVAAAAGAEADASASFGRARASLEAAETALRARSSSERASAVESANLAVQAAEDARAAAELRHRDAELVALRRTLASTERERGEALTERDLARADTVVTRNQLHVLEGRLPTPQRRMRLAAELLPRWLPAEVVDSTLVVHLAPGDFVVGKPELEAGPRERFGLGMGMLLGVGGFAVAVTPALQMSEDVRGLALAQHRARSVMDWLASLGIKATLGAPLPLPGDAEAALSAGPTVDLVITAVDGSGTTAGDASAQP